MRIISFIDQPGVIKKILQHIGLWEESHARPRRNPPACSELVEPIKEITFDPSYSLSQSGDPRADLLFHLRGCAPFRC